MQEGYWILEHPADIGIEARGKTMKDVFEFAALGLMSIIADPATIDPAEQRSVAVQGNDYENLLVRWLSEVLFLYDGDHFLVADVAIERLTPHSLEAVLTGEPLDERKHSLRTDVKAVTYHQLTIEQGQDRTLVKVFFDI